EQPADEVQVLPAGQLLVHRGVLAGQPDHPAQLPGPADHVVPGDGGPSGGRGEQGGEDPHEGGLARAVRPEHPHHGALAHVQIDAVQRLRGAVVLDQPPYGDGAGGATRVVVDSLHAPDAVTRRRQTADRRPTARTATDRTPTGDAGRASRTRSRAAGPHLARKGGSPPTGEDRRAAAVVPGWSGTPGAGRTGGPGE